MTISSIATVIHVNGYVQAIKRGESSVGLRPNRLVVGTTLYIGEIIGAIILILGHIAGLYVAAVSLISLLAFMVTGAWLLLMGVYVERSEQHTKK